MLEPTSRFSKTVDTGIRVPLNTHAPLRRSGTLSTAEHWDQSRVAMSLPSFHRSLLPHGGHGVKTNPAFCPGYGRGVQGRGHIAPAAPASFLPYRRTPWKA